MATTTVLKRSLSDFLQGKPQPTQRLRNLSQGSQSELRHSPRRLTARHYRSEAFAKVFLEIVKTLQIPSWGTLAIDPGMLDIHKVSGSLTNDVFFVSSPVARPRTLLLRVYGPSSNNLISRPYELHVLHILSSRYGIGPTMYGTFDNGRIEQFFDAVPLTPADLRDSLTSSWIGARMAELHSVDVDIVEPLDRRTTNRVHSREVAVHRNLRSWLPVARDVLSLPSVSESVRHAFNLDAFSNEWDAYTRWISTQESACGPSERVFTHNDTQYGNLLRMSNPPPGTFPHRQIIVVDFEYAGLNPAAFDIANHFHEWTADYHSSTPHLHNPSRYPNDEQRRNFYRAYLEHSSRYKSSTEGILEERLNQIDLQVRCWSPASHGMWAVWGLVQARESLEGELMESDFDYIGYALARMNAFRREFRHLGIQ